MFPSLTDAYDPALRKLALAVCKKRKIPSSEGVYVSVGGPSYETPAEIRAFRTMGGDVVGMSVVPEAIVARQMNVRCLVISWVSNLAAGLKGSTMSHPDVLALGKQVSGRLQTVIQDLLGHRHINTTTRYARVAVNMIRRVESPLEALRIELVPPA